MCYRIVAPPAEWDRIVAELHAMGTTGVEERSDTSPPMLVAWFREDAAPDTVRDLEDPAREVRVGEAQRVESQDWGRRWREGLAPRRVGNLWIRPSWCEPRGGPEVVLDPGRAFGTGEHATTRLALRLLLEGLDPGDTVLDLGTGSGILALAALRAGAGSALGIDNDPVACSIARDNARLNGLDLRLVCGTLDAFCPRARFDVVVANVLLGHLEPWIDRLARHARRRLILSGYLEGQRTRVLPRLRALGLRVLGEQREEQTGECWGACLCAHASDLQ